MLITKSGNESSRFILPIGLTFGVLVVTFIGMLLLDPGLAVLTLGPVGVCLVIVVLVTSIKGRVQPEPSVEPALPTVLVIDGVVSVIRLSSTEGPRFAMSFPLRDAHWHQGYLWEDASCQDVIKNCPAIILRAPRISKQVAPPSEFIATGADPEMLRIWQGFLRLSEVPEESRTKPKLSSFF